MLKAFRVGGFTLVMLAVVAGSTRWLVADADKGSAVKKGEPAPRLTLPECHELISAAEIEAEVAAARKRLAEVLVGVGNYNAHYKEVQSDGALIAALAGIALRHKQDVSWKKNALSLHEQGGVLHKAANGFGKKPFEASSRVFDTIEALLDKKTVEGLAPPPEKPDFAVNAPRKLVMWRIQKAQDWSRKDVADDGKFLQSLDEVRNQATLIATLVCLTGSNTDGIQNKAKYQQHVRDMIEAATAVRDAAEKKDFDQYKAAVNRVQKKCNDCHSDFVGGL